MAITRLDVRIDTRDVWLRRETRRLTTENVGKHGSARLYRRQLHDQKLRAVALQSIRGSAQRNAIVVEPEARAHHRRVIAGRINDPSAWRDIVGICLDRFR